MATRQYIGARYVPKFYQNSVDGSTQWESNVVYEPLMYVTLTNGHMYISKKQVPATVGSPVNNIDYWLDIGSYNGFIEQLQNEIDEINDVTIPAVQADVALKQNKTDNTLNTTSKTIVGAINEVDADVQDVQSDVALKQNKTDNTLTTTNKTIVGAINEVDADVQDVKEAVDDIAYTKLNGRRIVIITDSYGEIEDNFITQMQSVCPELVTNDNFFAFAYGGAGFVSSNGAGWDWQSKFVTSGDINTITNPNTITDIMVLGGSNDRGANISVSDIKTAAQTFYNSLIAKFPNAVVYVGYIGYSTNYLAGNYAPQVKQAYQECGFYGYRPIAHANSWLHYTGYIYDNVHPIANGSKFIANGVLNVLLGGGEDDILNNRPTLVTATMEDGFTSSNLSSRLYTYHYGHRSALKVNPSAFVFNSASLLFNGTWQKFATIGDSFLYGANDNYHSRVGAISCNYNGKEYTIPALFKLFNSGLYIQCYPCDELHGTTAFNLSYVSVFLDGFEADDIFM